MHDASTGSFTQSEEYGAGLRGLSLSLTLTGPGEFTAHVSQLKCRCMTLTRCHEVIARIAHVTLDPGMMGIMFRVQEGPAAYLDRTSLELGTVLVLGAGHCCHSRTTRDFEWGLITFNKRRLSRATLAAIGLSSASNTLTIMQPSREHFRRLLRLHRRALNLAHSASEILSRTAALAELEATVIDAVAECMIDPMPGTAGLAHADRAELMNRMEALVRSSEPTLTLEELRLALGVPSQLLARCCAEYLGVGPARYLHLRRLNLARRLLQHSRPVPGLVGAVAIRCGMGRSGRFAVQYRALFGELPSDTLRRTALDGGET